MDNKIFYDKLFPYKNGVNRNNIKINYECIFFVTPPRDAEKIIDLITKKMELYNVKKKNIIIVDTTACVGGDTINFCNNFGTVIPIEINTERYNQLIYNINLYNIKNAYVEGCNGDCISIVQDLQMNIDVIYVDPPWGPRYKLEDKLNLQLSNKCLDEIIIYFLQYCKLVVLKLPKNYDYTNLFMKLKQYKIHLYNNEFKKIDILFVEN